MKSFAVIGMSRFGTAVAKKLMDLGHEVLAIDREEHIIENISGDVTHAVIADVTEERNLKALGLRNYDCVVLAVGYEIADSVLITLSLKEMGVKTVICRARDAQHEKILLKIGADRVVIPEFEAGAKLAAQLADSNLVDYMELDDAYGISEINVPDHWVGKSIQEVGVRKKYGCTVVAIKNAYNQDVLIGPKVDYIFAERDIVVLIGEIEAVKSI